MAFAETQKLTVLLDLGGTLQGKLGSTVGALKGFEASAIRTGQSVTKLGGAFQGKLGGGAVILQGLSRATAVAGQSFSKFGGALGHAKGAIKDILTGPLGVLGLAGGVGGLGLAFEKIISHTNDFAFSVEKLTDITGQSAEAASTELAVFEKFNISAERTGQIVGFAEKTLGNLKNTQGALTAIDKQYGISLVDTTGKVVSFEDELKQVADVYTSSIDPADKAALAAKLFGRGYADLVPILALGSKGISDAEQAAKDLGLTLTSQNAKDLKDYRAALRETGDAIGGLELQIGLKLVPAIKDMAIAITSFLKNGGRDTIVGFFDKAVSAGRQFAGIVKDDVIPVLSGIKGAWDSIPKPFRDLIVTGLVANKTVKFLFGFSPITFAADALKSTLGRVLGSGVKQGLIEAGLGKLFVQPVFVTNPGFGLPGGGLPSGPVGAAEGAAEGGLAGSIIRLLPASLIAAGIVAASVPIGQAFASALPDWLKGPGGQGKSQSQTAHEAADAASAKIDFSGLANANAREDRALLGGAVTSFAGKIKDDLGAVKDQLRGYAAEFAAASKQLAHPKTQDQLVHAAQELEKLLLSGRGGAEQTAHRIDLLRKQLEKVHDPKTKAALEAKLVKIEGLLPGRQFAAKELANAQKILSSHESANKKIVGLQAIERALKDRGLPHAAAVIAAKIAAAQRATTVAQHSTTQAIKDKDLSVTAIFNANISVRDSFAAQRSFTLAGNLRGK